MNRKERRTRGKWVYERLNQLKGSPLLEEADLKDIPKDQLDQLIAGTHPNKEMQRKYKTINRIMGEIIELEIEIKNMQNDLSQKQSNAR